MAFEVPAGSCPRRVAVERRRRHFLAQDIGQLLQQAGVDSEALTPDLGSPSDPCAERPPPPRVLPTVTPLEEVSEGRWDLRRVGWRADGRSERGQVGPQEGGAKNR